MRNFGWYASDAGFLVYSVGVVHVFLNQLLLVPLHVSEKQRGYLALCLG